MKKQEKNNPLLKHKKILGIILLLIIYSILITGSTYAFMSFSANSTAATGTGGCFQVSYTGQEITGGDFLSTDNYLEGANTTVTLSKDASCKIYTEANIYLHTNNTTTAPIESTPALRFKLFDGTTEISEGLISNKEDTLLTTVPITNSSVTYTIYLWVDNNLSDGLYHDTVYSGYIFAESTQSSTVENSYQITFDTRGGNKIDNKIVTYNQAYGSLPTPTREGYTFKGWKYLPDDYQQVEYIESSGTQYIDTNAQLFNSENHEIIIDFEPTSFYNYNTIFGSTYNGDTYEGWIYSNGLLAARYNMVRYGTDNTVTTNTRYLLDIKKENTTLSKYINGNSSGTNSVETRLTTASLLLFLSGSDYGKYKLYNCKLIVDGTMIRNYIPTIRFDNQVGLYDTVTNTFYKNKGTGNFTAGPAVNSSTYITSTSTVTQANNHTLYAIWEPKTYTVSFNANGGTVSTSSKQVTYNTPYGDLPTPTRTGYTFKGWNGKNLINIANHNTTFTNNYYSNKTSEPKYVFTANKNYTLSFNYKVNSASNGLISSVGYGTTNYQRDIKSSSNYTGSGRLVLSFVTPATFNYNPANAWFRFVRMGSPGDANVDVSNIQLEEGSTETTYEPYILSGTTPVTQAKNHTLTAIWEQN